MTQDLIKMTARDVVGKLAKREVSPLEVLDALEKRIAAVDPIVNALPILCFDRARDAARKLKTPAEPPAGYLYGLPIPIKDLTEVKGVRCTYGSPIYRDHVPATSDILVEHIEGKGGIVFAKSNTPEFGAGSQTFNEVFGVTKNPWDTRRTCGGSSGGAAVSLATGMSWLATGSDFGGSLRNPASYCGVVGIRATGGRVARNATLPFDVLGIEGPMARNVGDIALFLDTMCGRELDDPSSIDAPAESFVSAVDKARAAGKSGISRIGFSVDLGGITPVDREVRDVCTEAAKRIGGLGIDVDGKVPDFSKAESIFEPLRAEYFAVKHGEKLKTHRAQLKPEMIWNIEAGLKLTALEIGAAEVARAALYQSLADFFRTHDLLVLPTVTVPPFDHTMRYPTEIEGVKMKNYLTWMALCFAITVTGCPAMSIPVGFTKDGRPIGLQLVAAPYAEHKLLAAAAIFEQMFDLAKLVPMDPIVKE